MGYSHPGHPENPERIGNTLTALKDQSALGIKWTAPGPCPDEALLRAHIPDHLNRLQIARDFDSDTPYYENIMSYARASAGAALKGLDLAEPGRAVFSLMRPPGHHATRARAMGFCYLSNAAIAALEARARGIERVAVFDFDVHHGNGTEAILLDVPGTAYYSIHQYPCYPDTGNRNLGTNIYNFPVPPQTPRAEYRAILTDALQHLGEFNPSLLIVSAGFDAYAGDPLAQETLEIEDYHWLGNAIRQLSLPAVHLLEGGYSDHLPQIVLAYLRGLDGLPWNGATGRWSNGVME
jgi:acetoin utilization deacetylase AcuC-like enzyme